MAKFENKAQCTLCTYIGRDKRSLQSHSRRIHQYCLECDVKYETKEDIMLHLKKVHEFEPKKYKSQEAKYCDLCDGTFNNLKYHKFQLHFNCHDCDLDLGDKAKVLEHFKTTHPFHSTAFLVDTFTCEFCSNTFRDKGNLTRHLKAIHSYCPDCEVDLKRQYQHGAEPLSDPPPASRRPCAC